MTVYLIRKSTNIDGNRIIKHYIAVWWHLSLTSASTDWKYMYIQAWPSQRITGHPYYTTEVHVWYILMHRVFEISSVSPLLNRSQQPSFLWNANNMKVYFYTKFISMKEMNGCTVENEGLYSRNYIFNSNTNIITRAHIRCI